MSDLTFVDIGANVGWFSYVMAGMGVNVIAFEPMEQNLYLIRKTLCNLDNSSFRDRIVVFPTGLSDKTRTCIVFSDRKNVGDGVTTCVDDPSKIDLWEGYDVRGTIPADRIDNIMSGADRKIVAVKMDTEGSEANIVLGGPHFFLKSKIPYISSEFQPNNMMAKGGGDGERFMRDSYDAGYSARNENDSETTRWTREYATNMANHGFIDIILELNVQ
jgi:FkbM family methyltransferase